MENITTKIEITLSVDNTNNMYSREIILNGKKVFFDKFDKKLLNEKDFIHVFTDKLINGVENE